MVAPYADNPIGAILVSGRRRRREVAPVEVPAKEPLLPWLLVNAARLFLYLVTASLVSTLVFVLFDPTFEQTPGEVISATLFLAFYGGLFCLPGAIVWLLMLSRLLPESSIRRRRVVAILSGPPLIGIIWLLFFVLVAEPPASYVMAAIYGALLPAGAGVVVRLRHREEAEEKEFVDPRELRF